MFYFDFLLAATVMFFWIRLLVMLKLTETFGPLLEIVIKMIFDMLIFFGIFTIQIVTFASVGILLFGEVDNFNNLESACLYIFTSSMGSFDFTIYDNMSESRYKVAILFQVIVLCMNLILLLNLLIAIMADTYSRFNELNQGLLHK